MDGADGADEARMAWERVHWEAVEREYRVVAVYYFDASDQPGPLVVTTCSMPWVEVPGHGPLRPWLVENDAPLAEYVSRATLTLIVEERRRRGLPWPVPRHERQTFTRLN